MSKPQQQPRPAPKPAPKPSPAPTNNPWYQGSNKRSNQKMKLEEVWKDYEDYTAKLTEQSRKLAFAAAESAGYLSYRTSCFHQLFTQRFCPLFSFSFLTCSNTSSQRCC